MHAHAQLPDDGQLDRLGVDDAPAVLDHELDALAGEPAMREMHVGGECRALEHLPRRLHARDLEVTVEALAPDAHDRDRDPGGAQGHERLGQRTPFVVGSIADDHETGERRAAELLPRAVERRGEIGPLAAELKLDPAP